MNKPSKSPDRHSFQKEKYIERKAETGEEPSQDYLDMFDTMLKQAKHKFDEPASRENNMEYDLVTTDWILVKARDSETYAQNLYAAICNNDFVKNQVWPILKQQTWSASWRSAGGIVADMRQQGDYINWYCSGIGSGLGNGDEDGTKGYVGESVVTDEIRQDLFQLGWLVAAPEDQDLI
jgi:hypothetical protein